MVDESILKAYIDTYFILERIKAGGVSVVYKAQDKREQIVAFKLLQSSWSEHEEVVQRFERETTIMQSLRHPHIAKLLDSGRYLGPVEACGTYQPGRLLQAHDPDRRGAGLRPRPRRGPS